MSGTPKLVQVAELTIPRRLDKITDTLVTGFRPDQFQALLDAAAELDGNPSRREYAGHGRLSAVLVLGLAGPRVSELANTRWRDFRASEGMLHMPLLTARLGPVATRCRVAQAVSRSVRTAE